MRPLFLLVLISCGPIPVQEEDPTPICDGVLQDDEGSVIDSTFDKDGDGFKDHNEPACADVYGQLDCDDNDPNVKPDVAEVQCNGIDDDCQPETEDFFDNDGDGSSSCEDCDDTDERVFPGNTEVCWDLVDNNCDAVIDEDCGADYNGNFQVAPPVQYACALGLTNIDFAEIGIFYAPPYVTLQTVGGGQPGIIDATIDPEGYFYGELLIDLGTNLDCDEEYRLFGTFSDPDHFTGTLQANYTGFCANCTFQSWDFTGTRIDETSTY